MNYSSVALAVSMLCCASNLAQSDAQTTRMTLAEHNANKFVERLKTLRTHPSPALRWFSGVDAIASEAALPKIDRTKRSRYAPLIARVARRYNMDPALIHAVVSAESRYDPYAISPAGAEGLMQLMPAVAEQYGVQDTQDPAQNLAAGTRHLRYLLRRFDNNLALAVAAYNAGDGSVLKYGRAIPPYPETRKYVPKVLGYYRKYQASI